MSLTYTNTFTITNARYLASKIASDLKQLQQFYGKPTDAYIELLIQELVLLLKDGYLDSIDYGFKKNGPWILALSYVVNKVTGNLDQHSGRIPPGVDITDADFASYRRFSSKYHDLSPAERAAVDTANPQKWVPLDDALTGLGGIIDKSYSSGGQQIDRKIYNP